MDCQRARETLPSLLHGDIGSTERVPLEQHVSECEVCRGELAFLRTLMKLRERPRSAPSPLRSRLVAAPEFMGRALGAMRVEQVAGRLQLVAKNVAARQLAVAAASLLLLGLVVFVFERGFSVGVAMRLRPLSEPSGARNDAPAPPPAVSVESNAPRATAPVAPIAPSAVVPPAPATRAPAVPAPPVTAKPVVPAAQKPAAAKPAPATASSTSGSSQKVAAAASPAVTHVPSKATAATASSANRHGKVDVAGRLRVKNRSEAERDLAALLARAGGKSLSRQRGPTVTVIEAGVPQANYKRFAQGMTRIGAWSIEAERSPLPDPVQVSVRLAEAQ